MAELEDTPNIRMKKICSSDSKYTHTHTQHRHRYWHVLMCHPGAAAIPVQPL